MADSVQTVCFRGMVLAFITAVVIFICFFCVMRVEQHVANNELARLGAERYTSQGQPNPWYFFVRDAPVIRSLTALPFLNVPKIEWTEKGFKFRTRDYEATYERITPRAASENDAGEAGAKPEVDYGVTVVKGKTHIWKARPGFKPISMVKIDVPLDGGKNLTKDHEQSPSDNELPDAGTMLQ